MIAQVSSINTADPVLNRIQAGILAKLNPVLACPLLNGTLVTADLKASGPVSVAHGLGRAPLGYLLAGQDAQADVWAPAAATSKVLVLSTSADVTVTLWVF